MVIRENININNDAIGKNLKRLINQTYKLLPDREENLDWQTPLNTIIEEFLGMSSFLENYHDILFTILCKLEGLKILSEEDNFLDYRRTIFECLNLMSALKNEVETCQ